MDVQPYSTGGQSMDWELLLGGLIALALLTYLVYSMLHPERF